MDFLRKNWMILAVGAVVLLLVMRRRSASAQGQGIYASTGTIVPGTEQPASGADGLTQQTGETAGPAQASRSGRGHF
jgi:hypothetical protein